MDPRERVPVVAAPQVIFEARTLSLVKCGRPL